MVRERDKIMDALSFIGHKSFKGTVFGPAEFLSERQQQFRRMTVQEMERYYDKVEETQGFDVDGCTGTMEGRIHPVPPDDSESWDEAIAHANFAATTQFPDKRLESLSLLKATRQIVEGEMYYLTFTAKDTIDGGKIKTFRAKVWEKPYGDIVKLFFFEELIPGKKPSTRCEPRNLIKFVNEDRKETASKMLKYMELKAGKKPSTHCEPHNVSKMLNSKELKPGKKPSTRCEPRNVSKFLNSQDKKERVGRRGSALAGFRNFREKIKKEDPSLTHLKATAVASEKWKSLSIAEKKGFCT